MNLWDIRLDSQVSIRKIYLRNPLNTLRLRCGRSDAADSVKQAHACGKACEVGDKLNEDGMGTLAAVRTVEVAPDGAGAGK